MAGVKFAKGSEEWQMFIDFWNLCQKYWIPEEKESYWKSLVSDAEEFIKKYNSDFARELAMVLMAEMEMKYKKGGR